MKTKTFILLSLLICNLLPAQNVKLDIKPHFLGVRTDSLFVSMDISVEIEDMNPKNAVILTPILTGQDRKILLPAIQLNGKQKQKLYVRNQILRKKKNSKESNTAYLVTGIDDEHSRTIAYQTSLPAKQWMNDAALSEKNDCQTGKRTDSKRYINSRTTICSASTQCNGNRYTGSGNICHDDVHQ